MNHSAAAPVSRSSEKEVIKQHKLWFVFVPLILLGVFFRFYNLAEKEFWHDETVTALCLSGPLKGPLIDLFAGKTIDSSDLARYTRLNPQISITDVINSEVDQVSPVHPPLFYLLTYFWAGIAGSGVFNLRLLPCLLSLLQIWGAILLGFEISGSFVMSGLAAALVALSPLFVLYAQELREYSLFQALLMIAAGSFLRALRKPVTDGDGWFTHGLSLIACMFTSLSTVFLMFAEFLYISLRHGLRSRSLIVLAVACSIAVLLFIPWCDLIVHNLKSIMANNDWTSHRVPITELVRRWCDNSAALFVDFGTYDELGIPGHVASKVLIALVLVIEAATFVFLCARYRHRSLLILLLIVINVAPPAVMDLTFGGLRSAIVRYFAPASVAMILGVAYFLYVHIGRNRLPARILCVATVFFLIAMEIATDCELSQATLWSQKQIGHQSLLSMARVINKAQKPVLLVSDDADGSNWEQIIALSRYIEPIKVQMLPTSHLHLPILPAGVDHFYLLNVSPQVKNTLAAKGLYKISPCQEDMDYLEVATPSVPGSAPQAVLPLSEHDQARK